MDEADAKRVADWWRRTPEDRAAERRSNWLEHPRLLQYTAERVTGSRFGESWLWAIGCSHSKPVDRMLSLGCGGGVLERRVADLGWARHIEGVDVSAGAVEQAQAAARDAGHGDIIEYRVVDVDSIELEANAYDAVFAQMSLHHVTELEHLIDQISRTLRPEGVLVLNEYTGPNRWQLPQNQLDAINSTLSRLPEKRRIRASDGTVKERYDQIDLSWFDLNDPSESVRSAEIMPMLRERMDVTIDRPYGGGLLQFLLDDIAWCFDGPSGWRALGRLAAKEQRLERQGRLASDFTVAVARPR